MTLLENNRSAVLEATTYFAFLSHKSATMCQINLNKVSNSKLRPNLCNYVKTKVIEFTAPAQQPHKRGTMFFGHPVDAAKDFMKMMFKSPVVLNY